MSSVAITLTDPWVYLSGHHDQRLPLSRVREHGAHLHGGLVVTIGDRPVPGLGYFGPTDVCVGMWAAELARASAALRVAPTGRYVFDEGEQGQPAYEFARESDAVLISLTASELSGAGAVSGWQRVPCPYVVFETAVSRFLTELRALLDANAGDGAEAVWHRWMRD
jgi:hypothetical protein